MIPKIIHYCWFGGNPLPRSAQKCINSWRKYFPDYEIKEWNESNFNVNIIKYTQDAYTAKKYAFVSDFARIWILYNYGGIYFDTDVEVIASMDDILETGAFMGCEICDSKQNIMVNPGLGIATKSGDKMYAQILDIYQHLPFYNNDKSINSYAIVKIATDVLKMNGLKNVSAIQSVSGITIYPPEYFNPIDSTTGIIKLTCNTRSIHRYANSWNSPLSRLKTSIGKTFRRLLKLLKNA